MSIMIYPEKMDPAAVSAHAAEIANVKDPMLASLCLITGSTLGGSKEYLTSIINAKDVEKLEYGESLCVFSPTGSGKTKAMELIITALSWQTAAYAKHSCSRIWSNARIFREP